VDILTKNISYHGSSNYLAHYFFFRGAAKINELMKVIVTFRKFYLTHFATLCKFP